MPNVDGHSPPRRRYGGRTAEERRALRRAALLDAGLELFGTRPYTEVSVADLVAAAGVTRRAFYECFADREALLRAVHDEVVAGNGRVMAAAVGDGTSLEDLERGIRALIAYFAEDPRRIRIQFDAVAGVSAGLEDHRRHTTRELARAFSVRLGTLAGPDDRARLLAVLQWGGGISALFADWQWSPDYPLDLLGDEIVRSFRARFG